jgi:hypothetical protein
MGGDDREQVSEHPQRGDAGGVHMPGEESSEVTFELLLIHRVRARDQFEQRVSRAEWITAIDCEQEALQGVLQAGVQPAHGPEVEQAEAAVAQDKHVSGVRIGVKDTVDEDLSHEEVEQGSGQLVALGPVALE